MDYLKRMKYIYIVFSILLIIFGLWIIVNPHLAMDTICILAGIFFLIFGTVRLLCYFSKDLYQLAFQFDFGIGIFAIVMGLVLILDSKNIINTFPMLIGIVMLMDSGFKIQIAFDSKRFGITQWWTIMIFAIATAILGICLIFLSLQTMNLIIRLIGINFCLDGILNLYVVEKTVY